MTLFYCLPRMVKAIPPGKFHLDAEQFPKSRRCQQLMLIAIRKDSTITHHHHAVDLRKDVGKMMRDQQNAGSLLRQPAQGVTQFPLRCHVERVAGLVKQEDLRTVNQSAADQDSLRFSGGHVADGFEAEVLDFKKVKDFIRAGLHLRSDMKMRPQGGARKESREDGVAPGGMRSARTGKLRGHYAEVTAQLAEIPLLAAENAEVRTFADDGIALASEGLDQRGFSAAVGAEDRDVFPGTDPQRDFVQHDRVAARDRDVFHVDKKR